MDPAALPTGSLEVPSDRGAQSAVVVAHDELDAVESPLFQRTEELAPEHLVLAVSDAESEDLAASVVGDGGRHHNGPGACRRPTRLFR